MALSRNFSCRVLSSIQQNTAFIHSSVAVRNGTLQQIFAVQYELTIDSVMKTRCWTETYTGTATITYTDPETGESYDRVLQDESPTRIRDTTRGILRRKTGCSGEGYGGKGCRGQAGD